MVLYFTATGNSLYAAKQFDMELVSIPQELKKADRHYKADSVGVICPLYERDMPHGPDDLITPTETGRMNSASNLEHRMKVILKNAGLQDIKGGLHIFRKTFATQMYERRARVEEIAAYIGDLESTTRKYYIAIRKKVVTGSGARQVVKLPEVDDMRGKNGFKDSG